MVELSKFNQVAYKALAFSPKVTIYKAFDGKKANC